MDGNSREEGTVRTARHAAGQDPAKRRAILAGANSVFMEKGFDAASVNDICRAAGVSKSTLYVYFANKEELFEAMVEAERNRLFEGLTGILDSDRPPADVLGAYGCRLAAILCSDQVVRAQRIVIGIAERMPELGSRFFAGGAMRTQADLARYFERQVAAGHLTIPDPPLAAAQFVELATARLWKPRLFGKAPAPPTDHEIEASVAEALVLFLKVYGSDR